MADADGADLFTRQAARHLGARLPSESVAVAGRLRLRIGPADAPRELSLEATWEAVRDAPAELPALLERLAEQAVGREAPPPALEEALVQVRDARWLQALAGEARSRGGHVPTWPVGPELWEVLVVDGPGGPRAVDDGLLRRAGWTPDQARRRAHVNLARLATWQVQGDGAVRVLFAGGRWESSLLALPSVWDRLARTVRGRLVASAPTRDVVLFTGTGEPDGPALLAQAVKRVADCASVTLHPAPLCWDDGAWAPYDPLLHRAAPRGVSGWSVLRLGFVVFGSATTGWLLAGWTGGEERLVAAATALPGLGAVAAAFSEGRWGPSRALRRVQSAALVAHLGLAGMAVVAWQAADRAPLDRPVWGWLWVVGLIAAALQLAENARARRARQAATSA